MRKQILKILFLCLMVLIPSITFSQSKPQKNTNIKKEHQTNLKHSRNNVLNQQEINKKKTQGYINGHEYVDLGLPSNLKWATCNIGADNPYEPGDYFAWGESYKKDGYFWHNYFDFSHFDYQKKVRCKKYTLNRHNDISPDSGNDVARNKWRASWRIPKEEEIIELIRCCQFEFPYGQSCIKIIGPSGNFIILPLTGKKCENNILKEDWGYYWTSSRGVDMADENAYMFCISWHTGQQVWISPRYWGACIRPVSF